VTGRSGSIGRVFYIEDNFWPLNTTLYVKDFHGNYPKFVYYLLSSFNLKRFASGAGVPTLNRNRVHEEPVGVPVDVQEQKRIVALLDEAFAGIETAVANTEKNLDNARELFESYLNSLFDLGATDWTVVNVSDIAEVRGGKRVPKGYKLQAEPTPYPYISVSDFDDFGSVNKKTVKYITQDVHDKIARYTISDRDVYISIAGTIGKSGIVPSELNGANLTENACKLVLSDGVEPRFVYLFTTTRSFKEQALKNTRTTAQPKLALSRLQTIQIPLPTLEEQQRLIEQVDELREETQRLERKCERKLAALVELKQSILQKACSGELTAEGAECEVEAATA
jgi:type I restriction enzyme S subunit